VGDGRPDSHGVAGPLLDPDFAGHRRGSGLEDDGGGGALGRHRVVLRGQPDRPDHARSGALPAPAGPGPGARPGGGGVA